MKVFQNPGSGSMIVINDDFAVFQTLIPRQPLNLTVINAVERLETDPKNVFFFSQELSDIAHGPIKPTEKEIEKAIQDDQPDGDSSQT